MRIEPPPPSVSTTRLADPGRGPAVVGVLVLAFVATAIGSSVLSGPSEPVTSSAAAVVQPDTRASIAASAPSALASEQATPTQQPSLRPGELTCLPAGWRLAYAGSMASFAVETWLAIEPIPASGPLDAGIPVAPLGRDVVSGLGACAPPRPSIRLGVPAVVEHAWRVVRAGAAEVARPVALVLAGSATASGPRPDTLALVRPASSASGWTAGEYVLQLGLPDVAGQPTSDAPSAWVRIEVQSP